MRFVETFLLSKGRQKGQKLSSPVRLTPLPHHLRLAGVKQVYAVQIYILLLKNMLQYTLSHVLDRAAVL